MGNRSLAQIPFLGTIAAALNCILVDRASPESRSAAKNAVLCQSMDIQRYPPILIYPQVCKYTPLALDLLDLILTLTRRGVAWTINQMLRFNF